MFVCASVSEGELQNVRVERESELCESAARIRYKSKTYLQNGHQMGFLKGNNRRLRY